jgi:hypothetical protein
LTAQSRSIQIGLDLGLADDGHGFARWQPVANPIA